MKNIFKILFLIIICSCSNKREELSINVYTTNDILYRKINYGIDRKKQFSKITFNIENKGNKTVLFVPFYEALNTTNGLNNVTGINNDNIIVKDENNKILVPNNVIRYNDNYYNNYLDSLNIIKYKQIGYSENFAFNNVYIEQNFFLIPPKSKLFFESYICFDGNSLESSFRRYSFDYNKKYFFRLQFKSDSILKKYLTQSQLKTIKENNYKIFHGTLVSNAVPIKFVD